MDKLTLRELRTFADMSDEAKQAYAEARISKTVPKVATGRAENKVLRWLGEKWDKFSDMLCKLNNSLEDIALIQDEDIQKLEEEYKQLCKEADNPPEKPGWRFWKWFGCPEWQIWKL